MLPLILGLLLFFAVHLVPTSPSLRNGLVERFGPGAYRAVFAVLSLIGFVLIVVGYHKLQLMPGKNPVLWNPPSWTRHIAFLLMLPAMIALVAAIVPSRIRTALKHPMLVAIKAWALVYDRISIKRRPAAGPPPAPASAINDVIVVVGGVVLFAAILFWGHGALIGVPLVSVAP